MDALKDKKMKMTKQLKPSSHPTAVAGSHRIWHVGSGGGPNPLCQILTKSVQWFWSHGGGAK